MALSEAEEVALVGLLRMLVKSDGRGSSEESAAYEKALTDCLGRKEEDASKFEVRLKALEAKVDKELPNDEAVRKAAVGVKGKDARDTIFAALADVAAADAIVSAEASLLEWLAAEWKIEIQDVTDAVE